MIIKNKKYRLIIGALLIYTTIVALYFLVFLERENTIEEYLTIGFSYLVILLLWFVFKRKQKFEEKREKDLNK